MFGYMNINSETSPDANNTQPELIKVVWASPGNVITTQAGMQYIIGNQLGLVGLTRVRRNRPFWK